MTKKLESLVEKPNSILQHLEICNKNIFPNVNKLLKIYNIIPVTTAQNERSSVNWLGFMVRCIVVSSKEQSSSGAAYCFQMDQQAVKLLPKMEAIKAYYKQQLANAQLYLCLDDIHIIKKLEKSGNNMTGGVDLGDGQESDQLTTRATLYRPFNRKEMKHSCSIFLSLMKEGKCL